MFSVGILLQRLVIAVFFVGVIAGLCWYDENIKLQVLSLKIEALIFLAGRRERIYYLPFLELTFPTV